MSFRWVLALVALSVGVACHGRREPQSARPNILLVTIDTFRADRLNPAVTPNLDRLARRSVVFTSARTAVPLTLPSHTTMLTGLLPGAHGVRENGLDRLSDTHATVATLLKQAGYQTAAFVGAFVLDRRFGLARGFDVYDDRIPRDPAAPDRLEAERPASAVVDAALAWLGATRVQGPPAQDGRGTDQARGTDQGPSTRNEGRPFFIWIHLYDPHAPYSPPAEFAARATSPYDGEVMYADAQLARIWTWLDAAKLTDRTVIVVAGDHGEGLNDHGERTHGMLLYDSTLRVPLVVSSPGAAAARRADAVTLADVPPTLLVSAGVTPPANMDGRDLLGRGSHSRKGNSRALYSETAYPRVAGWSSLQALTDGRWKAIRSDTSLELYDVQTDAPEVHDAAPMQQPIAQVIAREIDAIRSGSSEPPSREVSPDAAERLRALGYVTAAPQRASTGTASNPARHISTWNAFEDALAELNARRPAALPALEAIARANPDSFLFTATTARAAKELGRVADALAMYRDAAKRWPTEPTVLHDLAVTADEAAAAARGTAAAALRAEARRAEQAALVLRPDYAAPHNGLGLLDAGDGRDPDAITEFTRATALDPTNAQYWANLGNARRATNDGAGAEAAYRRALALDSRASDAANGLGALLVASGRSAEAIGWFERAVDADPASVDARLNLGIALQQSGNPGRAAAEYRAVLAAPARFMRQRDAAARLLDSLGAAR